MLITESYTRQYTRVYYRLSEAARAQGFVITRDDAGKLTKELAPYRRTVRKEFSYSTLLDHLVGETLNELRWRAFARQFLT